MSIIKNLIFKTLRFSGLPFLFREILQRKKVTIVMFHDPAPGDAAKAFAYLAKHYNIIDLNTFLDACRKGDDRLLPDKALILTLDDGHIRNYELLPLLKKMNIPVTIFLCAGIIDTNRHYWFKFKHPDLFKPAMKQMSNREKLALLEKAGFWPEREFATPIALNKTQIREMQAYVNFQGHTLFHPCLPKCQDEEATEEIFRSKQILEQDYQLRINSIAYPNGDYSDRDIELVRDAGYAFGITVDYGFNTIKTDPYRLKRLSIDDVDNIDAVCVKASGVWTLLMYWAGKRRRYGRMETVERPPVVHQDVLRHAVKLLVIHLLDLADLMPETLSAACS